MDKLQYKIQRSESHIQFGHELTWVNYRATNDALLLITSLREELVVKLLHLRDELRIKKSIL